MKSHSNKSPVSGTSKSEAEEFTELLRQAQRGDKQAHAKAGSMLQAEITQAKKDRSRKPVTLKSKRDDDTEVEIKINYAARTITQKVTKPSEKRKRKV